MDCKKALTIGAGVGATLAVAYYLYSTSLKHKSGGGGGKVISVTQLWTYPVKSCSGMALVKATLDKHGFQYDREWVVVRRKTEDSAGSMKKPLILTIRENQKMKMISASIGEETDGSPVLILTADGLPPFHVPILNESKLRERKVKQLEKWDLVGDFVSEGREVADWLSAVLEEPVYLARCVGARDPTTTKYKHLLNKDDRVLAHDFSTLHIISEEGLAWIRKRANDATLNSGRFRPNIVVAGTQWPEEDAWLDFTVGEAKIRTGKHCSRCSIPTVNESAKLNPQFQPTATLREEHSMPSVPDDASSSPKPMFGLNCFHDLPANKTVTISLGDTVVVDSLRK